MDKPEQGTRRHQEQGFTLIELSIVLVIIGLIVGGVLVGQELIRAAEIRSVISQVESYNTAVNTFRSKYGGLPGDLPIATGFFAGAANGDGNLVLTDSNGTVANDATDYDVATGELINFFPQLAAATLIGGTYTNVASATALAPGGNYPLSKLKRGGIIVMSLNGLNRFHIGMNDTDLTDAGGAFTFSDFALTPNEAFQIDTKMDDGAPLMGNVVARTGATSALVQVAPAAQGDDNCLTVNTGAGTYNVIETNADQDRPLCQLQMRIM